jgi:hypothetical protein
LLHCRFFLFSSASRSLFITLFVALASALFQLFFFDQVSFPPLLCIVLFLLLSLLSFFLVLTFFSPSLLLFKISFLRCGRLAVVLCWPSP